MVKKLLSTILALVLVIGIVPVFSVTSSASTVYNRQKSLQYAQNHWSDGKGLCAEFVSDCLAAGGLTKSYQRRVVNLYNALLANGYGTSQKLTLSGKNIRLADNDGKIEAGDPVFFYCNSCGEFEHVSLCNGTDAQGYIVEYAHNSAKNGKTRLYTYPHCGGYNWTMYSISLNNIDFEKNNNTLYGEKSDIEAPKIISTLNLADGIYFRWNEIADASYYRVYRKTKNSNWKFLANTTDVVYTDKTAENGKEYTYTVRACSGKTYSQYYSGLTSTYLDVVTFNTAKQIKSGIKLTWNRNMKADGYIIYRTVNDGMWEEIAQIDSRITSNYIDETAENGNTYEYRIRAAKKDTVSSYNGEVAVVA